MANLFNITTATNNVTLDAQRTGKASFTVSNSSAVTVHSRARITSPDASIVGWFTVEGQSGRILAPAGTEQYTVDIAVPVSAAPKDYTFTLLMVDESNPDENFTEGPAVRVTVPAPLPVPPPKPFPWWIVAVAVVVLILIIGAVGLIVNANNQAKLHADQTSTAVALACRSTTGVVSGPYSVVTGFQGFVGTVVIQFLLPQANDKEHQTFPTGSHQSFLGGFPVCIAWTPADFVCNESTWSQVAGSGIPSVRFGGACPVPLPSGVISVNLQ